MADYVFADVSEFQPPVDDRYTRKWLSFRACDGDYVDRNVRANLAWAVKARAAGRLDGFTVYVVYRPGKNQAILSTLNSLGVPRDCHLMIDAETWGGAISGDHSAELDALAEAFAARQGSRARVWGYGNRNDLATLWANRPSWMTVDVASYGGSRPAGVAGWQYTDGQYSVPGLPSASDPFGACDHNIVSIPEDDMTPDECRAVVRDELNYALGFLSVSGNSRYGGATGLPAGGGVKVTSGITPAAIAAAVTAAIGSGGTVDSATVEAAVRKVFADAGQP